MGPSDGRLHERARVLRQPPAREDPKQISFAATQKEVVGDGWQNDHVPRPLFLNNKSKLVVGMK